MTTATDHALEQAERIVQYAKYSDRFMVVEGASIAERRAFVKLIGLKLPQQVRPVVLRADGGNGANALIEQLSTLLQLSAGIDTIEQLVNAATTALEGQERLLIVLEDANHWLDSDGAEALFELFTQAQGLARERLLFLLIGNPGLCERVETVPPLVSLVPDLFCTQLLGTPADTVAPSPHSPTPAAATAASSVDGRAETVATAAANPGPRSARSIWANPTLLIAAVVSVAVVSVGTFALLGRSKAPEPAPATSLAIKDTSKSAATTQASSTSNERSGQENSQKDQGVTTATAQSAQLPADHSTPRHVPFPSASLEIADSEIADSAETADHVTRKPEAEVVEKAAARTDTDAKADPAPSKPAAAQTASTKQESTQVETTTTRPAEVDNPWFRDQPRARAAIQMGAFGRLEDANALINRFVDESRPRDQWRIYTQIIDGKTLYTVTFGNYASAERARHAVDNLPAPLRELKPYPRSVGTIQDRLAEAGS
ncbi:MAG: SPOR domain-containing protein [Halothiobacillaceae bacterium]